MAWLLVTILFYVKSLLVKCDIVSIDITTADHQQAPAPNGDILITLWFNSTIYQYTLPSPSERAYTYRITTFDILGTSSCDYNTNAFIMLENDSMDSFVVDTIALHTTSGVFYGIKGRCFDDVLHETQIWLYDKTYSQYIMDNINCSFGVTNVWMCVDRKKANCEPYKQIIYFDELRPNQFINDAVMSDATNVIPQVATCPPSTTGINNPTYSATATSSTSSTSTTTTTKTTSYSTTSTTTASADTTTVTSAHITNTATTTTMTTTAATAAHITNSRKSTAVITDTIFITTADNAQNAESERAINMNAIVMWAVIGAVVGFITMVLYMIVVTKKRRQRETTIDESNIHKTSTVTATGVTYDETVQPGTEMKGAHVLVTPGNPAVQLSTSGVEGADLTRNQLQLSTRDAMKHDKIARGIIRTKGTPPVPPAQLMKCAQCGAVLFGEVDQVLCEKCDENENENGDDEMFGSYNMQTADGTVGE